MWRKYWLGGTSVKSASFICQSAEVGRKHENLGLLVNCLRLRQPRVQRGDAGRLGPHVDGSLVSGEYIIYPVHVATTNDRASFQRLKHGQSKEPSTTIFFLSVKSSNMMFPSSKKFILLVFFLHNLPF